MISTNEKFAIVGLKQISDSLIHLGGFAMNPVDSFIDYAAQFQFSAKKMGKIKYQIATLPPENLTLRQQTQVYRALELIESHLQRKIGRLLVFFMAKSRKEKIRQTIQEIERAKGKFYHDTQVICEEEARLKFYQESARRLGIKKAWAHDAQTIKIVSKRFWESLKNEPQEKYPKYEKYMCLFFQGEHILVEEDKTYTLYDRLRAPQTGAYLRGSRCYDHGTLNGKTGGRPPSPVTPIGRVANPQYGIAGPQIKSFLFGRVDLALDENQHPIFGQTFEKICQQAALKGKRRPEKFKRYTFIQTERAPYSLRVFSKDFWKYRVFSFCVYQFRKLFHFEKPNVGAYGYGHADKGFNEKSNPTLIKLGPP
ncbi:hypothetical protein PARA125_000517 [Parachlamydia sp. AcF125]|nr:hypothetical protein [Parachlamydia sp. AcF125]